jgi:hypothetical protein
MAGVHFDELQSVKQPVDPSMSVTAVEQVSRKSLVQKTLISGAQSFATNSRALGRTEVHPAAKRQCPNVTISRKKI